MEYASREDTVLLAYFLHHKDINLESFELDETLGEQICQIGATSGLALVVEEDLTLNSSLSIKS